MHNRLEKTSVKTKDKEYDIIIGNNVLGEITKFDKLLRSERLCVIVSTNVYKLYEKYIKDSFSAYSQSGKDIDYIMMDDGEETVRRCFTSRPTAPSCPCS